MGRSWYEDEGKFLKKKNTFNDFVDCADGLIKLVRCRNIYIQLNFVLNHTDNFTGLGGPR